MAFKPNFVIIVDDTALMQLPLATIILQLLPPILVMIWNMVVSLQLSFSFGWDKAHLMTDK